VAFLAIDDPGQIDARFAHQITAQLDAEVRVGEHRRQVREAFGRAAPTAATSTASSPGK
jgi:outer membrane protein assembly factor BamE (lipoprotein component of BamABCDE complex)